MERRFSTGLASLARVSVASFLGVVFLGAMTATAADKDYDIHNNTGVTMQYFYASPVASDDWGDDRLGNRVIQSGYYETIRFSDGSAFCFYDLRAEFEDGSYAEQRSVDVCQADGFNFRYTTPGDAAAAPPVSPGPDRVVNIYNDTGLTMIYFYSSSQDMTTWGADILGDQVLNSDNYLTVDFNDGSGACLYDFKAVFEDNIAEIERFGLDVCAMESYTFRQLDLLID
ncbi:hypothetical protein FVF75_05770 [Maritimibacter fusiformis]|uniref:Uncharacterized protein n=2 Tax=Maritimibacter fusiformis TaxID=2603819 RepID=A0A5D0RLA2_9RHOB|nr:hypothetical protein FVF75_05770 [Maritimibacter fusiformis]